MGKITRKVTVHPDDGKALTALELMTACAQMPEDVKPRAIIKLNGEIKRLEVEIEMVPDAPK